MPAVTTAIPATASRTQWFAVPTTATTVIAAYRPPRTRSSGPRITQATQNAQPTCSDGIAASSLVRWPIPAGADACADHQPRSEVLARVST
ncbi:hypothetical protein CLV70_11266 [Pseudosporangium ferrugineum]|uniref:Uncharacterized protein n=1 Tax=Pseudosporangium ferrugineum TaxID=439699 RepID=A0A2T0RX21_9ACTN|nr:hypothetical protein CLV70_11266 [Pseudosporangium ferrugineum]